VLRFDFVSNPGVALSGKGGGAACPRRVDLRRCARNLGHRFPAGADRVHETPVAGEPCCAAAGDGCWVVTQSGRAETAVTTSEIRRSRLDGLWDRANPGDPETPTAVHLWVGRLRWSGWTDDGSLRFADGRAPHWVGRATTATGGPLRSQRTPWASASRHRTCSGMGNLARVVHNDFRRRLHRKATLRRPMTGATVARRGPRL
jgi:hypothetical protein